MRWYIKDFIDNNYRLMSLFFSLYGWVPLKFAILATIVCPCLTFDKRQG